MKSEPTNRVPRDDTPPESPGPAAWRRLLPAGVLAAVAVALPPLGGFALLASLGQVGPWLGERPGVGVPLFVIGFVLLAGLALLPTYAQAVLAGYAFGVGLGTPAALAGFTGAALLGYAVARRAAGVRLAEAVDTNPRYGALRRALLHGTPWRVTGIVALLRLPPNAPFALSNVAFAGLNVPLLPYTAGTLLGMAPRTVAAVVIGAGLTTFDLDDLRGSVTPLVGIAVTVGVCIAIGVIAKRTLDRLTGDEANETEPAVSTG